MLVLSRKLGQTIIIGENIEVKVLDVIKRRTQFGNEYSVKLGVAAPREVAVDREEIRIAKSGNTN